MRHSADPTRQRLVTIIHDVEVTDSDETGMEEEVDQQK